MLSTFYNVCQTVKWGYERLPVCSAASTVKSTVKAYVCSEVICNKAFQDACNPTPPSAFANVSAILALSVVTIVSTYDLVKEKQYMGACVQLLIGGTGTALATYVFIKDFFSQPKCLNIYYPPRPDFGA